MSSRSLAFAPALALALAPLAGCAALLDRTPPQVGIDGPSELPPVQRVEIALLAADAGTGVGRVTVVVDGGEPVELELPPPEAEAEAEAEAGRVAYTNDALPDGEHQFAFTVVDRAWPQNTATVEAHRTVDRTPPKLVLAPTSATARQGRTWAAWLRADEPLVEPMLTMYARGDDGETLDRTVPLYPVGGLWRALRGIELREELGPHAVVIEAHDAAGNAARLETTVDVQLTQFEEGGYIRLSKKQVEARKDEAAITKMREERNAAYAAVIPDQHWQGPFAKPVPEAELTSPFGKYRTYSDGRKSYHTGLDLSEERGTPVRTAADGLVLVAHEMAIFGNVVIVAHGQGVVTTYNHLDEIAVEVGAALRTGDVVGKLGSTGQSTGPHLHWGMEVAEVAVDPGEWLGEAFSTPPEF
jgi:murein DD-endopeptidase MepM/ murein hydrolase activator NlpD